MSRVCVDSVIVIALDNESMQGLVVLGHAVRKGVLEDLGDIVIL